VGGCDILMNMHSSGELAELFEKADVLVPEEAAVVAEVAEAKTGDAAESKVVKE